ncbi:hypothetical protein Ddye_011283 [Dipteronia dyeriana]|uniref:Reverse transcriptase zinc-binding domain-containing protein n=1 Tax=Dipteronia dyeriana TaxID=168575 RepID=A0AAD9X283_9ROSI|nr:hypothetical protein Ddye_011283 [Dipteronia dyeriana]
MGKSVKRKIHTVDWNTLCNSKKNRGLGIGKILVKNESLLAKWVWRLSTDDKALWRRVTNARYRILSTDLLWDWKCNNYVSTFVKVVASLFDKGSISYRVLNEGLNMVIGGSKANFWDMSGGDSTRLKVACPRIFSLAVRKHGVVQDFGNWQGNRWVWKVALRRPSFDWKKYQRCVFMSLLDAITIKKSIPDTLVWSYYPDGKFSMESFRYRMEDQNFDNQLDHKFIWQGCCPPKIQIFIWQVLRGRIMVRQVLQNFGIVSETSLVCVLCNNETERIDHLFLLCLWAWKLWIVCMDWWGVANCANNSMKAWLQGWSGLCSSINSRRVWDTLFFPLSWTIWEAKNQMIFKGLGLKFNVDGSARGNPGNAGIGGVFRDNYGKVLSLFSDHIGTLDSISVEILAIHRAVTLCVEMTSLVGREIDIVSDFKVAVTWINSKGMGNLNHVKTIYEICNLLYHLGHTRVIFNSRASNSFADSLAKKGSAMEGDNLIWEIKAVRILYIVIESLQRGSTWMCSWVIESIKNSNSGIRACRPYQRQTTRTRFHRLQSLQILKARLDKKSLAVNLLVVAQR